MSDETNKTQDAPVEKIKTVDLNAPSTELSDESLDKIAGGQGKLVGSNSNIRNN